MSANDESNSGTMSHCASCGVAEGDNVKLKNCSACHLVKYCGIPCQKQHRPKHKRACKQRAAELHDEILFRQPEGSHEGDCPICMLPLSLDAEKCALMPCCSKVICHGCHYIAQIHAIKDDVVNKRPFCRHPVLNSKTEAAKRRNDRAEMNDPAAMYELGIECRNDGDYQIAFEYLSKAAELGHAAAHNQLAFLYLGGRGVEKNEPKAMHHFEQAAIGGHPTARYNLGCIEWDNGRHKRAVKHFIIAAKLGHDDSLTNLKAAHEYGLASKDDFAAALRGHQAAVEATKSPNRQAGEAAYQKYVASSASASTSVL